MKHRGGLGILDPGFEGRQQARGRLRRSLTRLTGPKELQRWRHGLLPSQRELPVPFSPGWLREWWGCKRRRRCQEPVRTQHPSPTIDPGSPPSLGSTSVRGDRLGNAEPVQHCLHLHGLGDGVHRESVAPAYDQRRPLRNIRSVPRAPLPANPPRPLVTAAHPFTESIDDIAANEGCPATTIREALDAWLRCSGVQ